MVSKLIKERFDCVEGERVIVRYPNRKYYDAETSNYVTLPQMRALAADGVRLRVYAQGQQRCITTQTLCQIIAQAGKSGAAFDRDALMGLLSSLPPVTAASRK